MTKQSVSGVPSHRRFCGRKVSWRWVVNLTWQNLEKLIFTNIYSQKKQNITLFRCLDLVSKAQGSIASVPGSRDLGWWPFYGPSRPPPMFSAYNETKSSQWSKQKISRDNSSMAALFYLEYKFISAKYLQFPFQLSERWPVSERKSWTGLDGISDSHLRNLNSRPESSLAH